MTKIPRRTVLVRSGAAGLGWLVPAIARAGGQQSVTPSQAEGPFYPVTEQADKDADLTRLSGASRTARGTVVRLTGSVRTVDGAPLPGALVEIWQACASGKYNHPRDRNPAPLDPDFQYWARVTADSNGRFGFRTIKPGAYPNDPTWMRPPHIHFRVVATGFPTLTSQMYFEGEALNDSDRILQALSPAQRRLVVVAFTPVPEARAEIGGQFDIVLSPRANDPEATPELD